MEALTLSQLAPNPYLLVAAVIGDLLLGDPVYRFHPIRLMGATLTAFEASLRRAGADGFAGGIILFLALAGFWTTAIALTQIAFGAIADWAGWLFHLFVLYSLLALGDLLRHVWRVEQALIHDDLSAARYAVSRLVGRDIERMDEGACRRAAIESLSENLPDGFISPLFWYGLAGLPGLVVFKVVSTMDSMVGFKTPRYLRFGWCGARLDDLMNYLPARASWLLIALAAVLVPHCSPRKALLVGARQHQVLPSPNSGWPEAATAGAIQRRLVGPIWKEGKLVTDTWIGDPLDPPASAHVDLVRATAVIVAAAIGASILAALILLAHR